ncbi:hypothetical protein GCM10009836_49730 [Pseudonocardia ailaonensis]|uniref:Integral membrane bound transporter domain-containing protein n=1 Tax=Pseudonocardia ailaonensis TaxID=367279 RepID=A0ABN2NCR6_9PSEU
MRIVVAAALGWQICVWLGATQPPIYAVIVPLLTLRDEPGTAWNLSFTRMVGVVAGLLVGIGVLAWLRPSTGAVALVLAVALGIGLVLRAGGAMNIQVAVSGLLVLSNPAPEAYALSRMWETAVGVGVTVVLAPLLFPTNPVRAFRSRLDEVTGSCATVLRDAAGVRRGTGSPAALVTDARTLDRRAHDLGPELAKAGRAVRVHPYWRRRFSAEVAALGPVADATTTIAALVRVHAEDLAEMRARPDAAPWLAEYGPHAAEVESAVADAVDAAARQGTIGSVVPTPTTPSATPSGATPSGAAAEVASPSEAASALAAARRILADDSTADPGPLGVVGRRPLTRILTVLQGPQAPLGPPTAIG